MRLFEFVFIGHFHIACVNFFSAWVYPRAKELAKLAFGFKRMRNNLVLLLLLLGVTVSSGFAQNSKSGSRPVPAVVIPFQEYDHLILLQILVNEKGPFTFILDTGTKGSSIFAPLANQLKLDYRKLTRYEESRDSLLYGKAKSVSYQLNTVEFSAKHCLLYLKDDAVERALGIPIHGILGSDLFDAFVVDIDYNVDSIRLYDPQTFVHLGKGHPIKFSLHKRIPSIQVGVKPGVKAEPKTTNLLLQTGWKGTVALNERFIEKWVGFDAFSSYYFYYRMLLPGHLIPMRTTIVPYLEIWGIKMTDMPLFLSRKEKALTPGYWFINGIVGNELLRRFNLVFDYPHNVVYVSKNKHFDDPAPVSRSGLELKASEDLKHVFVHKVHRFSPAAEADIKEGDEVIGIYDVPMEEITLSELRDQLMDGTRIIILYVQRGKMIYKKSFRLRPIL